MLACLFVAASAQARTEIHLITIGPGDHLLTRSGHTALMVAELDGEVLQSNRVYNYGDADFDNKLMPVQAIFSYIHFFLSSNETLDEAVRIYGYGQARTMSHQKLNLSDDQIQRLRKRLESDALPENREYIYHHLEASCATKARDLIDEVTGGAVREQLGGPTTDTTYQDMNWAFSGHAGPALAATFFFGRPNHHPHDRYYGLYDSRRLSEGLLEVDVPGPDGPRALSDTPEIIVERQGPPVIVSPSLATWMLMFTVFVVLSILGWEARKELPRKTRSAGFLLGAWALPFGLAGLFVGILTIFSTVPEVKYNEMLLVLPLTDLVLLAPAVQWFRQRRSRLDRFLAPYAVARLSLLSLYLAGWAGGLFIQRPIVIALVSWWFSLMLLSVARRSADT